MHSISHSLVLSIRNSYEFHTDSCADLEQHSTNDLVIAAIVTVLRHVIVRIWKGEVEEKRADWFTRGYIIIFASTQIMWSESMIYSCSWLLMASECSGLDSMMGNVIEKEKKKANGHARAIHDGSTEPVVCKQDMANDKKCRCGC